MAQNACPRAAKAQHPNLWRSLVFTNGSFNLLYGGYVRYGEVAKSLGRSVVVGLNSDRSSENE
ncbi:MAG: hypothetical protein ICV63_03015 [Coleofasciculus sp. Co-bin14]|nr:hypothetical protein [Coleofasciculus sp. Co-bin14]